MKSRFIKFGAIFMTAVTAIIGAGAASVQASPIRAGVGAVMAEYLHESAKASMLAKADSGRQTVAKAVQTAQTAQIGASQNKKRSKSAKNSEDAQDGTICGYTNLGIANVSNYLNVRQKAGEDEKIVGKLPADAGCEILDEKDGWYHIRSGKVSGYVRADYIITGDKAKQMAEKLKKTMATVNTLTVYIREKPNTDCTILTIVTTDEELEVVEEGDEWIEIKLDDENGFVNAQYVNLSEELKKAMPYTEAERSAEVPDTKYSLVQTALSYVGGRYVWGGASLTSGVDCSGFTMQIMAKYGVYLPHSSRGQAGYGRSVSTSELQPGDLIFYGSGSTISHVAIYIGNGQIVHASNSRDGIKVSNAFYRTPICCRRMF
ncbi:MAG: C40 family peptidase [Eubacterium sp.]|nr:C40 family peptidase [Eubacterium sp.]